MLERPKAIKAHHLGKLAIAYIRQSSQEQVEENTGSTEAQRALAQLPLRWAWPESRVRILEDLGRSGSLPDSRPGFLEMLRLIDRGEVGIVLVTDVSRLGRNGPDLEKLLHIVTEHDVLVYVDGKVYDPSSEELMELFALRMQGLFASFEQANRTRRLRDGKRERIKQGFAVSPPPSGLIEVIRGKWDLDPDPLVQASYQRIFELYLRLQSAGRVACYHRQHELKFWRRRNGQVAGEQLTALAVIRILRNPAYAGAYVFNRTRSRRGADGRWRSRALPRTQWRIIHGHHPAYVTWEEWERIQEILNRHRPGHGRSLRNGAALLDGLLWCERCERLVKVTYQRKVAGTYRPAYICRRVRGDDIIRCMWEPAERIDSLVAANVLAALDTAELR